MMTEASAPPPPQPRTIRWNYWTRRLGRNALIGLLSVALTLAIHRLATDKSSAAFRWSMATGYAGILLIGAALLLGPWWLFRGRRPPVSSDLRRDIGLWGAVAALLHVATGLKVHMQGDMLNYFFYRAHDGPHTFPIRIDPFGIVNWTGLAATLLLVLLLVISNDWSLRALGAARWKRLQQATYIAAGLSALHGLVFQKMDKRNPVFVVALLAIVVVVVAAQLYGRRLRRSRA